MDKQNSDIELHLVGAWALVEWSVMTQDGDKRLPLGGDAIGQIIYTADGSVAAQLVSKHRQPFPSRDWREAATEEAARAFKEYFGYFGRFSVDTKRSVVTHHVEGAWFPNLEGGDQQRSYVLENDLLVLDADTAWGKLRIVWRKKNAVT